MKLLDALKAKLKALVAEADVILAKAEPNADEMTRLTAITTDMEALQPQIETAQKAEKASATWANSPAPMLPVAAPGAAAPTNEGPVSKDAVKDALIHTWFTRRFKDVPDAIHQIGRELYSDPYRQVAWEKNREFLRYMRTGDCDPKYLKMVLLTPDQLIEAVTKDLTMAEIKTTMVEGVDTLGGFVVPEDFRAQLVQRLPGMTVVRSRAMVLTTSSSSISIPTATGGTSRYTSAVRVTWSAEIPTAGDATTNATFGQLNIPVHTVMADTQLSLNLLEDAAFDLGSYVTRVFSEAMAIDEDQQFLTGSGVGRPEGILNGTAALGAPFNANVTTVNTGAAAALTADGVIAVPFGLDAQYRQSGATWCMARATLRALRQLKDGTSNYLLGSPGLNAVGFPRTLLDYPIAESEAMPAVAANTYPIIFGDFGGYYIADRVGMSVERFRDSALARTNSVMFTVRRRLGGQVAEGWRFVVQLVAV